MRTQETPFVVEPVCVIVVADWIIEIVEIELGIRAPTIGLVQLAPHKRHCYYDPNYDACDDEYKYNHGNALVVQLKAITGT